MNRNDFVTKFENTFLTSLSKKQKRKYKLTPKFEGYLWMAFNLNLVKCLSGNKAKEEFDKVDKNGALEIQYDNGLVGDDKTMPLNSNFFSAENINNSNLYEFYVIGKDFSWCYVVTHEGDNAGPYFCYANEVLK